MGASFGNTCPGEPLFSRAKLGRCMHACPKPPFVPDMAPSCPLSSGCMLSVQGLLLSVEQEVAQARDLRSTVMMETAKRMACEKLLRNVRVFRGTRHPVLPHTSDVLMLTCAPRPQARSSLGQHASVVAQVRECEKVLIRTCTHCTIATCPGDPDPLTHPPLNANLPLL